MRPGDDLVDPARPALDTAAALPDGGSAFPVLAREASAHKWAYLEWERCDRPEPAFGAALDAERRAQAVRVLESAQAALEGLGGVTHLDYEGSGAQDALAPRDSAARASAQ